MKARKKELKLENELWGANLDYLRDLTAKIRKTIWPITDEEADAESNLFNNTVLLAERMKVWIQLGTPRHTTKFSWARGECPSGANLPLLVSECFYHSSFDWLLPVVMRLLDKHAQDDTVTLKATVSCLDIEMIFAEAVKIAKAELDQRPREVALVDYPLQS